MGCQVTTEPGVWRGSSQFCFLLCGHFLRLQMMGLRGVSSVLLPVRQCSLWWLPFTCVQTHHWLQGPTAAKNGVKTCSCECSWQGGVPNRDLFLALPPPSKLLTFSVLSPVSMVSLPLAKGQNLSQVFLRLESTPTRTTTVRG